VPLTAETPWTEDELVSVLRAQGERYHHIHPFHRRMDAGELTKEELRRWVVNRYYYQKIIPMKDAAILSNCPDRDVRRDWIVRITDHDGSTSGAGGGIEAWLQLGQAVGVAPEDVLSERWVLPGVRYACDAYLNFCRQQPWVIAVASSLTELFGPKAIKARLEAFERYYPWIDPEGLAYFRARLDLAPRDADYALRVVMKHCLTRAAQQAAVDALTFKCDMLWAQLDAIDAGDTRPEAARP
jgi:pyrroloquinoline-quinone synthase